MPLDWNSPTTWNTYGRVRRKRTGDSGAVEDYSRELFHQFHRDPVHGWDPPANSTPYHFRFRWEKITALFPQIQTTDRIIVLGAGPGYLIEAAKDAGYPNIWGIDSSTEVAGRTDIRGDVVLVDLDAKAGIGGQAGSKLRQLTGDDVFDWVISEQLLECLTDAEIGPPGTPNTVGTASELLARNAATPASRCIHLVIPDLFREGFREAEGSQDPSYNWHTLAEYEALLPGHWIVSMYGDWTVAGG